MCLIKRPFHGCSNGFSAIQQQNTQRHTLNHATLTAGKSCQADRVLRTSSNDNVPKSCLKPKALLRKKCVKTPHLIAFRSKIYVVQEDVSVEKMNTCKTVCSPALKAVGACQRCSCTFASPHLSQHRTQIMLKMHPAGRASQPWKQWCTNRSFIMRFSGAVTVTRVGLKPVRSDVATSVRATHLSHTFRCTVGVREALHSRQMRRYRQQRSQHRINKS